MAPYSAGLLRAAQDAVRGVVVVPGSAAAGSSSALRPIALDVARDGREQGATP